MVVYSVSTFDNKRFDDMNYVSEDSGGHLLLF